jgi:hypothetical protein
MTNQGYEPQIEFSIPNTQSRIDVFVKTESEKGIAIELELSLDRKRIISNIQKCFTTFGHYVGTLNLVTEKDLIPKIKKIVKEVTPEYQDQILIEDIAKYL